MHASALAPPEFVQNWTLSCVLHVRTSDGTMYFKASAPSPLFADEARLLTYLAQRCPDRVPDVVAAERTNGWMLLRDAGSPLPEPVSLKRKFEILNTLVGMQRRVVPDVGWLLGSSICVDRRPETLLPLIEPMINDSIVGAYLTDTETAELAASVPTIVEMCTRLARHSLPPTLVHGDLHAGNALLSQDGLVLLDWAEACIAHPFMDAFMIYNEQDAVVRNRMRDAFLSLWSDYESIGRLLELWSACGVVHAIHHVVSYYSILRHTPEHARGDLANTLPFLLRKVLRYLREPA